MNVGFVDVFVVYVKIDGDKFFVFIVECEFLGVLVGLEEKKMGIKSLLIRILIFEDVFVLKENVLGEIGKGYVIVFNILNIGCYKFGVGVVGVGKCVLEIMF